MGSTNADRQRRYRQRKVAHEAGDHSLCDPKRCSEASGDAVTGDVTPPVTRDALPELGKRGRRLWRDMTDGGPDLSPSERVLLEEACRLADRLDRLDAILRGNEDAWMRFRASEDGTEVTVVVDRALAEARQQQATLKQLVAELRQSRAGTSGKPGGRMPAPAPSVGGGDVPAGVTSLAARIAAKRGGQAAG